MKRPSDSHVNGRCSCGVYRGQRHNPKCPHDDPGPRDMAYDRELSDAQTLHKALAEVPIPTTREEPQEVYIDKEMMKSWQENIMQAYADKLEEAKKPLTKEEPFECIECGSSGMSNHLIRNFGKSKWICESCHRTGRESKEVKENPGRPKSIEKWWDGDPCWSYEAKDAVAYIESLEVKIAGREALDAIQRQPEVDVSKIPVDMTALLGWTEPDIVGGIDEEPDRFLRIGTLNDAVGKFHVGRGRTNGRPIKIDGRVFRPTEEGWKEITEEGL